MPAPRTTVLSAGALTILVTLTAAACGSSSAAPAPAAPPSSASPASVSSASAPAAPGVPVAPSAGKVPCAGWPSAPAGRLPRSFQAASVLRCVTGTVSLPGQGQWTAATLEKADQGLAPLTAALNAVSGRRETGQMCPQYVIAPPQIILVGKDGTRIRPSFPVTGCGQIQQNVLSALAALHWQTVSRRLLAKISS